jgi:hypothetical protein
VCILAATEYITEMLSASPISNLQASSLLDGTDQHNILKTMEKLGIALSDIQIPSVPNHLPESVNMLALQELVSCRDACKPLLEEAENSLRRWPDELRSQLWGKDARDWLRAKLSSTLYIGKLERLSHAVTRQVSSVLR